jgi:stage II sporulation protein D
MAAEPVITVGIVTGHVLEFHFPAVFSADAGTMRLEGNARASLSGSNIILECGAARMESSSAIQIAPDGGAGTSFVVRGVTIGLKFHWERKEDQRFPGALRLVPSGEGIVALNVVSVEEYLTSVISSEMSAGSSRHLLEAHAIVSRSWLLAQLDRSRARKALPAPQYPQVESATHRIRWYDREDHELFDVCADDHCQRYQGMTNASTPAVRQAVAATRGTVLMEGDAVCDARFSKSCGGISEPFATVWEPVDHPALVSVVDADPPGPVRDVSREADAGRWIRTAPPAFCNTADPRILSQVLLHYDQETKDFYRWRVEYRQEEITELIRRKSGIDFGRIVNLVPVQRGPSGRLCLLTIQGEKRTVTIGKELEIRRTLSPTHLYSSAFVVDAPGEPGGVPERFVLTGAGWGHGVGMCQIGAAVMGESGYTAEKILRHYFKETEVRCLY